MKDNPYSKIVEIIKEKGASYNPPSIQIGTLISVDPITFKIGELQIDKDNIMVSSSLSFANLDLGSRYAIMPVNDRQLYIVLVKLKEV